MLINNTTAGHNNAGITEIEHTRGCIIYSFVVYTIICGTLCVLGVVGNIAAFAVFQMDTLKTSTTFLFQGLSLTDTVLLVVCFPVYCISPLMDFLGHSGYTFENIYAYVVVFFIPVALLAQTATIWVTVLVGINRYIAVCLPYQASRLCSVVKARQYLAVVLIMSLIFNIPRFLGGKVIEEWSPKHNRSIHAPGVTEIGNNTIYNIVYHNICYSVFMLVLPLLILTILNIRLINTLKEIHRRRSEMQTRQQQQDNNVTFVLIIVVLVFTVCQAPALVNQILWNVLPAASRECGGFQFYFSRLCNLLVIVNSAVNFVIYILFNKRFKSVIMQHVCCGVDKYGMDRKRHAGANGASQTLLTHV